MQRALWLLLAAMAAAAVVVVGIDSEIDRREALAQATDRAESMARQMERSIRQTLAGADFVLGRAIELARRPGQVDWRRLHELEAGLPEKGRLLIFDADGTLTLDSRIALTRSFSIADQPYFKAHRAGAAFAIGPMAAAMSGDGVAFTISRPIADEGGRLVGIAVAAIDADDFKGLHDALGLGEESVIGVYTSDGRIVLRQPDPESHLGHLVAEGRAVRAARDAPYGALAPHVSTLDGIERLTAFRVLDDFGLIAVVGIATDEVMTGWWRTRLSVGGALALFMAALAGVAFVASRGLTREQEMVGELQAMVRDSNEAARLQAEQARRANEDKTRFLAAASHDLRQPLQAAGMFVEVLAVRLGDTPHQAVINKLRQSIEATGSLLSTLLDVTTLEAGKVLTNVAAFPLMPLLAGLAEQMEPQAEERHLRLKVVVTSAWVVSDRVLLERLLRNLLVNALRYTEAGGILLGCRRQSGGQLAIDVVDTGIGIPEHYRELIFEDFTRVEAGVTGSGGSRGPGLGLGVVRRMAQLLGHRIELRSALGKGSIFRVIVPTVRARWLG